MIRSRASKSYWVIMVTMLLVHHTMAGVSVMSKRQAELEEDPLFHVTSFLDDLEANLLETLDYLIENQEAQDRVLLEDVQNLIFAVQSLDVDPSLTPVALAAIATNPTSLFLIGSIVVSTVIASQVSSLALVVQTLTFNTDQGGLVRMLLDIINSFMSAFNNTNSDKIDIVEYDYSGDDEDGSGSGDRNIVEEEEEESSGADDDYIDEDESGLLPSITRIIRTILGGNQNYNDEDYEASGEASGDEEYDNDDFHVDIQEQSLLDIVFNIIPDAVNNIMGGNEDDYEYVYDMDNKVGVEMPKDPTDGGSSIGGMTISFHSMDLAKLFVDVQKSILETSAGVNCTCGEEMFSEENVTQATIKLIEEARVKKHEKKKRYLRSRRPKLL